MSCGAAQQRSLVSACLSPARMACGLEQMLQGAHRAETFPSLLPLGHLIGAVSFLQENGLSLVVRSHDAPAALDGVKIMHDGRVVTVFSASNYCGSTGSGACFRMVP
eukprot:3335144-Amphidinium_carterae.1